MSEDENLRAHGRATPDRVCDVAIALERLLMARRMHGNDLLSGDMYDRWGPKSGPERDALTAQLRRSGKAHRAVSEALTTLAAAAWASDPAAVTAWALAHVALLDHFMAGRAEDTARHVAAEERAAWLEVAAGTRPWVEENVYFVPVNAELHRDRFGEIEPGDGG